MPGVVDGGVSDRRSAPLGRTGAGVKPALRLLLLTIAIGTAIIMLVWAGGIIYWHIRITMALKAWEKTAKDRYSSLDHGISRGDYELLNAAGCRALPYLVGFLDKSQNPEFQEGLMSLILSSLQGPAPWNEESIAVSQERSIRWSFEASNLDFQRERAMSEFNAWWLEHGRHYHQWWRFWSPWCKAE
jgi:hypothetical protein